MGDVYDFSLLVEFKLEFEYMMHCSTFDSDVLAGNLNPKMFSKSIHRKLLRYFTKTAICCRIGFPQDCMLLISLQSFNQLVS